MGAWVGGALLLLAAGCGSGGHRDTSPLPRDYVPVPIGRGPAYELAAVSAAVSDRRPIDGLECSRASTRGYGVHLELYARRRVLLVPAGIGIAPPQRHSGAYVRGGSCSYPIRTFEPTGVVVVGGTAPPSLGALFDTWGQRLSQGAVAGFRGRVEAFVGGRRWQGSPRTIPLRRHVEIVLEVGSHVVPHRVYRFPPGL